MARSRRLRPRAERAQRATRPAIPTAMPARRAHTTVLRPTRARLAERGAVALEAPAAEAAVSTSCRRARPEQRGPLVVGWSVAGGWLLVVGHFSSLASARRPRWMSVFTFVRETPSA